MTKKHLSTFEREMQDPLFREQFEKEYDEFLLSEIIKALMKNGKMTVRKLAEKVGLSPTVIQKIRSGSPSQHCTPPLILVYIRCCEESRTLVKSCLFDCCCFC